MTDAAQIVHIIDDDPAALDSLEFLLTSAGLAVRAHASGEAFVKTLGSDPAACVITDVRMPGMSGIDLVRHLTEMGLLVPVIVITGHASVPLAVEAMKAGAFDFVEKPFKSETIIEAVGQALEQKASQTASEGERVAIAERVASLSTREHQVLDGVVAGHPNKVIAHQLGISPRTVEVYRSHVMTKMQAKSLSDLVRMSLLVQRA